MRKRETVKSYMKKKSVKERKPPSGKKFVTQLLCLFHSLLSVCVHEHKVHSGENIWQWGGGNKQEESKRLASWGCWWEYTNVRFNLHTNNATEWSKPVTYFLLPNSILPKFTLRERKGESRKSRESLGRKRDVGGDAININRGGEVWWG